MDLPATVGSSGGLELGLGSFQVVERCNSGFVSFWLLIFPWVVNDNFNNKVVPDGAALVRSSTEIMEVCRVSYIQRFCCMWSSSRGGSWQQWEDLDGVC